MMKRVRMRNVEEKEEEKNEMKKYIITQMWKNKWQESLNYVEHLKPGEVKDIVETCVLYTMYEVIQEMKKGEKDVEITYEELQYEVKIFLLIEMSKILSEVLEGIALQDVVQCMQLMKKVDEEIRPCSKLDRNVQEVIKEVSEMMITKRFERSVVICMALLLEFFDKE